MSRDAGFERVVAALDSHGRLGKATPDGYLAHCPGPNHDNGDRNPSLSVRRANGMAAIKCFADCDGPDILDALGMTLADLYDDAPEQRSVRPIPAQGRRFNTPHTEKPGEKVSKSGGVVGPVPDWVQVGPGRGAKPWTTIGLECTGATVESSGRIRLGSVRYLPGAAKADGPKVIAERGATRDLFWAVLDENDRVRWVTEGEADAQTAVELDLQAVGIPGSGYTLTDGDAARIADGADLVFVVADADTPGRKAAQEVAARIAEHCGDVRVWTPWPDRSDGSDFSDFVLDQVVRDGLNFTGNTGDAAKVARAVRAAAERDAVMFGAAPEEPGLTEVPKVLPPPAPPGPAAWHGPLGAVARTLAPTVEAAPAGLLVTVMAVYGGLVGKRAWFPVGSDRHHPLLWPVIVGPTGSGKGTALRAVLAALDESFGADLGKVVARRITTGEALIHRIRDPRTEKTAVYEGRGPDKRPTGEWREDPVDPGADEKRLLLIVEELAGMLGARRREGNSLSATIREAWDGGKLEAGSKASPETASNYTVGLIGHVTRGELSELVSTGDALNGLSNRFLWAHVPRGRPLANPPEVNRNHLDPALRALAAGIASLPQHGIAYRRTPAAAQLWDSEYPRLWDRPDSTYGAITERARAWVTRLSLLYAVADSAKQVDVPHLRAALELWAWVERSAASLFAPSLSDRARRIAFGLLEAGPAGLARGKFGDGGMRDVLGTGDVSGSQLDDLARELIDAGVAVERTRPTAGRPARVLVHVEHAGAGGEAVAA